MVHGAKAVSGMKKAELTRSNAPSWPNDDGSSIDVLLRDSASRAEGIGKRCLRLLRIGRLERMDSVESAVIADGPGVCASKPRKVYCENRQASTTIRLPNGAADSSWADISARVVYATAGQSDSMYSLAVPVGQQQSFLKYIVNCESKWV